ncbi:MAG: D-alanyl-D-alanine carboxypeptidase/D-alanyl-D-alanine-endopeptidase [Planctomycetota bacterium]
MQTKRLALIHRSHRTPRRASSSATAAFSLSLLLSFAVSQAHAGAPLQTELAKIVARLPHKQAIVAAHVVDLAHGGAPILAVNADQPMTPASTMKVFSMTAALRELGPQFAFETILATDGANLMVIGDGDPGFGDERLHQARGETIYAALERWADAVRENGKLASVGDLIFDASVFDDERIHPTWERDDLGKWYAAPVAGLNFNDNCLDIVVTPAGKGAPANVVVNPVSSFLTVLNACRTGGKGAPVLHHPPGTNEYKITGQCSKRWAFSPVAFHDPPLLFGETLRTVLARNGVHVAGKVRFAQVRESSGALPPQLRVLAVHRTPIEEVLARAGKNSQNLFAECLLKRAGVGWARRTGQTGAHGSWELGSRAVGELLRSAGIDRTGLKVADGSGLSRANSCTARQLTELLAWSSRQPFGRLLEDSLAEAGVDGSLRRRLKNSAGRVHAKTGTMNGIRALTGYVDDGGGPRFAFAVLFNNYPGSSAPYKDIQDRFCQALIEAANGSGR